MRVLIAVGATKKMAASWAIAVDIVVAASANGGAMWLSHNNKAPLFSNLN